MYLESRFGIPETLFEDYLLLARKQAWWLLRDSPALSRAARFKIAVAGLKAFERVGGFVKPSTRMIQVFGHLAARARFDVDEGELQRLIDGEHLPLETGLENGYVILSFKGMPLGLGLLINGVLRSQLPRKERLSPNPPPD
ncbi:MAG: hypothetical protein JW821_07800 [Deltaproteobacteria bacterium]|nr:hypothetical protein [Deltaproteobacteria bacterium]